MTILHVHRVCTSERPTILAKTPWGTSKNWDHNPKAKPYSELMLGSDIFTDYFSFPRLPQTMLIANTMI